MHTIKVKINGAEFEASGEPEAVKEQYAEFIKLLAQQPVPTAQKSKGNGSHEEIPPGDSAGKSDPIQAILDRVFRIEGDIISLNVLPEGEGSAFNAVLLLLYGHDKIGGRSAVKVDSVLKGLNQSGANYEANVARIIAGHGGLVTKAGVKRGTRYGLTNRGRKRAEEVLREIV